MATFASCFVSPFYTFVLFCPILNLPRCFYNKHSDSKIVLNLPSLRLNFPTDIERERGENKIEGAKYFSVFSIFRSCWKKPHIYILHVFPFIRLTKIIHLWLKYFMYMYMLLSRRRPTFPPKFIFCSFYVWRFATAIQDGSQYFVLLIITDGIITDMQQTQQAIVNVIIYFQFDLHDYIILNQK